MKSLYKYCNSYCTCFFHSYIVDSTSVCCDRRNLPSMILSVILYLSMISHTELLHVQENSIVVKVTSICRLVYCC